MKKSLALIWWLIQINAIIWVLMIGTFLNRESAMKQIVFFGLGLFVAAALEFVFYYKIYKPSKRAG